MVNLAVFARTLVRKGGSLAVTIPFQIAEKLGLNEGEQLVFIHKDGKNYSIIGGSTMLMAKDKDLGSIAVGALGLFGKERMSKEEVQLILREMVKEEKD